MLLREAAALTGTRPPVAGPTSRTAGARSAPPARSCRRAARAPGERRAVACRPRPVPGVPARPRPVPPRPDRPRRPVPADPPRPIEGVLADAGRIPAAAPAVRRITGEAGTDGDGLPPGAGRLRRGPPRRPEALHRPGCGCCPRPPGPRRSRPVAAPFRALPGTSPAVPGNAAVGVGSEAALATTDYGTGPLDWRTVEGRRQGSGRSRRCRPRPHAARPDQWNSGERIGAPWGCG